MENHKIINNIKKSFYTYRNGIVADILRKAGNPHTVIFGLQLPQIKIISDNLIESLNDDQVKEIGLLLWDDNEVRESRILACRLLKERVTYDEALEMAHSIRNREEADLLTFYVLKYLPKLSDLLKAIELETDEKSCGTEYNLTIYLVETIKRNMLTNVS